MENIQNLPKHQQAQLEQHLVNIQARDSLSLYMSLVENCFGICVNNFRTKNLDKYETRCLENCAERYIKTTNRAGIRFQEFQEMQMKMAQGMPNGGGSGAQN